MGSLRTVRQCTLYHGWLRLQLDRPYLNQVRMWLQSECLCSPPGILGAGGGSGGSANQLQNRPLPHPNDNKVRSETEGASLTGMSVVPGFCNGFHGALRPGYTQAWDFIADAANPNKMATTVKPCAAIRVRIMSWDRWLWPRWKQ